MTKLPLEEARIRLRKHLPEPEVPSAEEIQGPSISTINPMRGGREAHFQYLVPKRGNS